MDEPNLLNRVSALEEQVKALSESRNAETKEGGRLRAFARFLIANWVLLSFLSAIFTAVYVRYRYQVDYFESYRNISDTKKLASFYERMGDRMMAANEWTAAEEAYQAALKLNPNNTAATFGIAKAEVFQPVAGAKYTAPEVVDAKLDYLLERFPDDYQVYFLKAIRYREMGRNDQAEAWFDKCIQRNSTFTGCYLELGFLKYSQGKLAEAQANFTKALQLDPNSTAARNDLAACQILQSNFVEAVRQFAQSYNISPTAVTSVSLGEAYWFVRMPDAARQIHQIAAEYMEQTKDPQDRFMGGEWASGFLPLRVGDRETIKQPAVSVYTFEEKKALIHLELAIDQALLGKLQEADREFETGMKLEHTPQQNVLMQNRFLAVENIVPASEQTKAWLAKHRMMLQ
ncbi:MAG: tetratricopeptide repeat protein [Terriglobales bacterium]